MFPCFYIFFFSLLKFHSIYFTSFFLWISYSYANFLDLSSKMLIFPLCFPSLLSLCVCFVLGRFILLYLELDNHCIFLIWKFLFTFSVCDLNISTWSVSLLFLLKLSSDLQWILLQLGLPAAVAYSDPYLTGLSFSFASLLFSIPSLPVEVRSFTFLKHWNDIK